jgi:thioredoxin 1
MTNCKIFLISFLISCATLFCYGNESEKTLIIFSAKWCKYCTIAKNDLRNEDKLVDKTKEFTIIDVDYDKEKDIAKGHNIKTLPTFIIFKDGKELKRQTGYNGPDNLLKFLQ